MTLFKSAILALYLVALGTLTYLVLCPPPDDMEPALVERAATSTSETIQNSLESLVNAERTKEGNNPSRQATHFDRARAPKRITCSHRTIGHIPHPTA